MSRLSFTKNPAPLIVDVIRERTVRDAVAAIKNGKLNGAQAYDLHLSALEEPYKNTESIREILSAATLPVMALSYSQTYDNRGISETEEQRVSYLKMAVDAGVSCIDMQAYTFDRPCKEHFDTANAPSELLFAHTEPHEVTLDAHALEAQRELVSYAHAHGTEVLISCHTLVPMSAEELVCLGKLLVSRGADAIKIVGKCDTDQELAEAFRGMLALKREITSCPVHFHCGGEKGRVTRILHPMVGSYLVFCTDRYTVSSNFDQLELSAVSELFRRFERL